jgi:hypothetical protein
MYLVSALRPRTFVELGIYHGVSYCAFCQAAKKLDVDMRSHGVDTWEGDGQSGGMTAEEIGALKAHHDPLYGGFSEFIRSTFDNAVQSFSDGSIDLLHIDGLHTYETVKHDFEKWLPKMSDRGMILFHDTNVRQLEFGVWKFWEEVSARYKHLTFNHGHGLGLLAVGTDFPEDVRYLLEADGSELSVIRDFFHQLGARIDAVRQHNVQCEEIARLRTYEATVKKSKVIRAYRALRFEGLGSFINKVRSASNGSGDQR